MKQKIVCLCSAVIGAAIILLLIDLLWLKGTQQYQTVPAMAGIRESNEVVKEFIYENYVISEKNPWTDCGLDVVEYQEVSTNNIFSKEVNAKAAILVDVDDRVTLYEKNSNERLHPASTTKLMTALTVLQVLKLDDVVQVGDEVDMIAPDSSKAGFKKGQIVTVRELLEGMLIASGNDGAYILARAAGQAIFEDDIAYEGKEFSSRQCVERFILEMNKNVRDMELENTNFATPDGYDCQGQYTTASDLAKIATLAYENDTIRKICGMENKYSQTLEKNWVNTNALIDKEGKYYYKYCIGMKTGTTDKAGKCLVSVASKNEDICICVVLNEATEENRWSETIELLKFGIE